MVKDYSRRGRKRKTRLQKIEARRNIKQAFLFGFLSLFLVFILIFLGLPLLIKAAVFLGDLGNASRPLEKKDTIPPNPPTLEPIPEATNSSILNLSGLAEAGSIVKIKLNNQTVKELIVDSRGRFTTQLNNLKEGKNTIKALTIDKENNQSDYSSPTPVILDTEAPQLEISKPQPGEKFFEEKEIRVEGSTERDTTVSINQKLVIVDGQGNFSTGFDLKEGNNKITVRAEDEAGNETQKTIEVTYQP